MHIGGTEQVFLSLAKSLKKTHNIEFIFVVDRVGVGETERIVTKNGFKLISLDSSRTLETIIPLKRQIDLHKPQLILSAYTDTNFACAISCLLAKHKTKLIVSEHASLIEHWASSSFFRRQLLSIYVRFGYVLSDHILGVSKGIAKQLVSYGHSPDKVSYIHNPIRFIADPKPISKAYNAHATSETIKLLAVGRVSKQKDYATMIRALNRVCQSVENIELTIVGGVHDSVEKAKLERLVSELKIQGKVKWVDFTDSIGSFYANADIFLLTSAWEGFGNVIVEAMAFGLPVVSTNCNYGPSEIITSPDLGYLIPVGNDESFAHAVKDVISKLSSLDRNKLYLRASDFSENKIAIKYLQLFKRVLES